MRADLHVHLCGSVSARHFFGETGYVCTSRRAGKPGGGGVGKEAGALAGGGGGIGRWVAPTRRVLTGKGWVDSARRNGIAD